MFVRYVLDLAEIPTFQSGDRVRAPRFSAELAQRARAAARTASESSLRPLAHRVSERPGAGGLPTLRFEAVYTASLRGTALTFADRSFASRIGWREVTVRARDGARVVSSSVPAASRSDELRSYPRDLLRSPLDVRSATVRFVAGTASAAPPRLDRSAVPGHTGDGLAGLIGRDDPTFGVVLLSLLVAAFWGAAHALTPGHGKALVAGYLVGTRGRPRHAFALGATVTVTHTAGVFGLGLVTLGLSTVVVPEQLYPWLTLVSGVLVVGVGAGVLVRRALASGAWPPRPPPCTTTTTVTTMPRPTTATTRRTRDPRDRRRRGPAALPVGARRAAERDRAPPARLRAGADRRVQRRPRGDDHCDRPRRRARPSCVRAGTTRRPPDPCAPRCVRGGHRRSRPRDHVEGDPGRRLNRTRARRRITPVHTEERSDAMFGLDDWIAGLSDGGSITVVVAVAVLLGLRHATDPDHIAAVTTLVASGRERATVAAARLGAWWGAGHALTLVVFGIPILLADRYLPDALQRGAETAVAALIVFLAVRLIVRWRHGAFAMRVDGRRRSSAPGALAGRSVRDRTRPRHGWERRRRRPAARGDPVDSESRSPRCSCSHSLPRSR